MRPARLRRSLRPRPVLLALALLLLSGCAQRGSEPAARACALLPLRTYPAAEQGRVADEIDAAAASAAWPGWIADYGALRDAVRACKGAN